MTTNPPPQGRQFNFPTTEENEIFHQHLSQGRTSQALKCLKTEEYEGEMLGFNQGLIKSVLVTEELAADSSSLMVAFSAWESFFRKLFRDARRFPLVDRFQLLNDVIEYSNVTALDALKDCGVFNSMEMSLPLPKVGYTPLTLAITKGSDGGLGMLQCLMSVSPSTLASYCLPDVNVPDAKGATPLSTAVTADKSSVAEWLLRETKADPKKEAHCLVDGLPL